jgi:valyl-tRNA synthetase
LYTVFDAIVKLIAPYLPHIAEEIYQDYFRGFESKISIHITDYPHEVNSEQLTTNSVDAAKENFAKVIDVVEAARKYKTEKQISMGAELQKLILSGPQEYLDMIGTYMDDVIGVTKTLNVEFLEKDGVATMIE